MTPKDVLKMAKEKGARFIDLRFIDLPGLWQHFSIPLSELNEGIFEDGLGFDGSSIRGFQSIAAVCSRRRCAARRIRSWRRRDNAPSAATGSADVLRGTVTHIKSLRNFHACRSLFRW